MAILDRRLKRSAGERKSETRTGRQIDPGVSATQSMGDMPLASAAKSGNVGTSDFFANALECPDGAA